MKKKILFLTTIASLFVLASCSNSSENNSINNNSSDITNDENITEIKKDGFFDNWDEIEVYTGDISDYTGHYMMKVAAIKVYGTDQYGTEVNVALGNDNYVYGKQYSETYDKYFYISLDVKYEVLNDSIVKIKNTKYLIQSDLLIALDGSQLYLTKGEPLNKNLEDMTLKFEVNNKAVDVTWESNATIKDLKTKIGNKLTIYMNKAYSNKFKWLEFNLTKSDTDIDIAPGDLIVYDSNRLCLYFDAPDYSVEEKRDCTKLGHINMSQADLKNLLAEKETVSVTFILE